MEKNIRGSGFEEAVYFCTVVLKHERAHRRPAIRKGSHEIFPIQNSEPRATIVYDGECPFCSAYVRLLRLRDAVGPVALVDARQGGPAVDEAAAVYDLNDGMVLKLDGVLYHGHACLNRLALLSTRSGAFNRLTALLFSRPGVARLAYPVLRAGRALTLRLLRRPPLGAVARPRKGERVE